MNNRILYLTALEAGKSEFRVPARSSAGEKPLLGLQTANISLVASYGGTGRPWSLWSFIRALISFTGAPSSRPNHSQRLHFLIPSHQGSGFNRHILQRHKHSEHRYIDVDFIVVNHATFALLILMNVLTAQLCLTFYDFIDCRLPNPPDHGIFQARILKQVASPFSRVSSQPRD